VKSGPSVQPDINIVMTIVAVVTAIRKVRLLMYETIPELIHVLNTIVILCLTLATFN